MWWLLRVLIVGLAAGWLAGKIMNTGTDDWGKNLLIGIIGSFVGWLIGIVLGLHASNIIGSIILSVIGACLAMWIYGKYIKK